MEKVISTEKLPIKLWLNDLEQSALEQAKNLANLPFAFRHIAIMPDSHFGFGMPIGGVLAAKNVIIPNAVGADIGCGMCAVKTSLTEISTEDLKKIMGILRKEIPLGKDWHKTGKNQNLVPEFDPHVDPAYYEIVGPSRGDALKQIGTLGGGNHFIEIQKGSDGFIWLMLHSGSRNVGKRTADHYNALAISLNEKWHSGIPKHWELAYLPIDSKEGQAYLAEMNWCVKFALANRKQMMTVFKEATNAVCGNSTSFDKMINIAHNYAQLENHFGQNVWIHRKGATLASTDTIGIIPGSLGSPSYIVNGLGNRESFNSCSHGAGRKMGREVAKRTLNLEEEIEKLNSQGIVHGLRHQNDLDESVGSYKNIDEVMKNQSDLVSILVKLQPLASIKG
ncbi:MAG: RtcB family protein [Candidatus Woesearchaeota archaeon]|jgi:tRNA-splicing ligase RtcB